MTNAAFCFTHLSDEDLLAHVANLAARERDATARLVASLAELDKRRLYLGVGCSSLFTYGTQVLHLSEHAAYLRIEAARVARRFPLVLALLADGSLNLTTVRLLAPHLTPANHQGMLDTARHLSKREVEHLVARLQPGPAVRAAIRTLPGPKAVPALAESPGGVDAAEPAPQPSLDDRPPGNTPAPSTASVAACQPRLAIVSPLAPERYKIQLTVGRETYDKLRRVQDLLRHVLPSGDLEAIVDRALTGLLADLARRTKLAQTDRPRAGGATARCSRHVPAAIRRAVWARDGGRCAFVGTAGRCTETGFLEFHHVVPHAAGGVTSIENVELRCPAHNGYEAELYFGTAASGPDSGERWNDVRNSVRTEVTSSFRSRGIRLPRTNRAPRPRWSRAWPCPP